MISVSLTFPSLEDAITALAKLRVADAKVEAPKVDAPVKPPKDKPADKPVVTQPSVGTGQTVVSDYKPVGDAIAATVAAGKKAEAVALLAKYGAKSGKELKPEQYADFMVALAAINAPEADFS